MNRVADAEFLEVDFDECRQVLRQAADFDVVDRCGDGTAFKLDAGGDFAVQEVQRDTLMDGMGGVYPQEVAVQDQRLPGVHLGIAQQGLLAFAIERECDNRRTKTFLAQVEQDFVVVDVDHQRISRAPVDDGRDPVFATQAAARSGPLQSALARFNFKFHGQLLVETQPRPRPGEGWKMVLTALGARRARCPIR
jgi:hypothetical protein